MNVYLVGLLIGIGMYVLTYLFAKEIENKKRVLLVVIVGALTLFLSLTVIGGFEGMPFVVLGLGVLTIAVLFGFFGKSLLVKQSISGFVILFVILYSAFMYFNQIDYTVVNKTSTTYTNEVNSYIKEIENDTSIKGYKIFPYFEGDKGIVLSLGGEMAGNNIEVLKVEEKYERTFITIRTFYNQSKEKNPYIIVGLDRVQPEIIITDTNGLVYEQIK